MQLLTLRHLKVLRLHMGSEKDYQGESMDHVKARNCMSARAAWSFAGAFTAALLRIAPLAAGSLFFGMVAVLLSADILDSGGWCRSLAPTPVFCIHSPYLSKIISSGEKMPVPYAKIVLWYLVPLLQLVGVFCWMRLCSSVRLKGASWCGSLVMLPLCGSYVLGFLDLIVRPSGAKVSLTVLLFLALFSLAGLWGHRVGRRERDAEEKGKRFMWRLAGMFLMLCALLLVVGPFPLVVPLEGGGAMPLPALWGKVLLTSRGTLQPGDAKLAVLVSLLFVVPNSILAFFLALAAAWPARAAIRRNCLCALVLSVLSVTLYECWFFWA
jgi:hypothetical protein